MPVTSLTSFQLKWDRYDEFVVTASHAKSILEQCGARRFRLFGTKVHEEMTASLAVTWEADDLPSYGAAMNRFITDSDGLALLMSPNGEGSTVEFQGSIWSDIEATERFLAGAHEMATLMSVNGTPIVESQSSIWPDIDE